MKVLIADDSPTIRMYLKSILLKENFEVVEAGSGNEAVEIFKNEDFDLVTMDVEMPGLNGYEACSSIRSFEMKEKKKKASAITPVLFVTANDTLSGRIKGFESGCADFITKPFSRDEILHSVQNIFNPRRDLAGSRVLVVEDSFVTRALISKILIGQGAEVSEAETGVAALDIIKNDPESIDIIMTDYFMPGMNGDEFCHNVRNRMGMRDIPIIFVTGIAEHEYVLNIYKAGGSDYIIKPFIKEEIIALLNLHVRNLMMSRAHKKQMSELKKLHLMKDDIMKVLSHDLRTPLNAILGYSQILKDSETDPEKVRKISYISQSGSVLLGLIQTLNEIEEAQFSNLMEVSRISLSGTAETAVSALIPSAEMKNIRLYFTSKGDRHFFMGNENALFRILNNLIGNSVKFTENGGEICVSVSSGEGKTVLTVEDSGIGMPEEFYSKLPETGRSSLGTAGEKGTGLGLSIVKTLTEKMNGFFEICPVEKKGSRVRISFPLCSEIYSASPSSQAS